MDICTFWFGKKLRFVDRICLKSMLLTGHHVRLFCYEPIENVPEGIEICDAHAIMPLTVLYRLAPDFPAFRPEVSVVQFSDFFRIALMKHQQGFWLDTDVYLLKPLSIDPTKPWLARENAKRLGVSALYLPVENPIIEVFENYLEREDVVPWWLGFKRRVVRPLLLRAQGLPVTANRLGITIFGNDGISRLAKRFGFFKNAYEKETFYYWTGHQAARIFDPAYGQLFVEKPEVLGFHIHRKEQTNAPPIEGSFYAWAVARVEEKKHF